MKQQIKKFLKEYKLIFIFLFLVFIIRSIFINWYIVPSGSMYPNLRIGQYIFTNRVAYALGVPFTNYKLYTWSEPKRGDIVIAFDPDNGKRIVKRVIAIGGDNLVIKDGNLIRNGEKATYEVNNSLEKEAGIQSVGYKEIWPDGSYENILKTTQKLNFTPIRNGVYNIPKGYVMLMGDNRDNSKDSRYFGFVKTSIIEGRIINDGK